MADYTGTSGADNRYGTTGADRFSMLGGNDTALGQSGSDTMSGGAGADVLDGGQDSDTVNGDDGNDTIYGGYGADLLRGGGGGDSISGGLNASDTLQGGDGNDSLNSSGPGGVLVGGKGADRMLGAGGGKADRYVFDDGDSGAGVGIRDTIVRLEAEVDRIDLRPVDGSPTVAGDQPLTYIGTLLEGAEFTGPGQVRVVALDTAGNVITRPGVAVADYVVQVNTAGSSAPEMEILLDNTETAPSAGWFLL